MKTEDQAENQIARGCFCKGKSAEVPSDESDPTSPVSQLSKM